MPKSDAGKGDKPRPFFVTRKEYEKKFEDIDFSKHRSKDFKKVGSKITKTYK
jgi:hypothetical protein